VNSSIENGVEAEGNKEKKKEKEGKRRIQMWAIRVI
jgi:hypothetical protein